MAIDRVGARRRVRLITGWVAGGAAALTSAFAFGASRGAHVAKAATRDDNGSSGAATQDAIPQAPQNAYPQAAPGYTPPSASTSPPQAMSGGS